MITRIVTLTPDEYAITTQCNGKHKKSYVTVCDLIHGGSSAMTNTIYTNHDIRIGFNKIDPDIVKRRLGVNKIIMEELIKRYPRQYPFLTRLYIAIKSTIRAMRNNYYEIT